MGGCSGKGELWGGALPSWQQRRSQECLHSCVKGKEAGRFALLLLSPLLAFLGPREQALAGSTGGGWVAWGARGAWCDILPSFVGSMAVSALLRAVLGKARLTLEQWLGRRDGEKETRGWGPRRSCLRFRGPWSPGHVQGFKKGEWSNQFSDKAIYYPQSSWLFCLSCVTQEVGMQAGERQEWDAV